MDNSCEEILNCIQESGLSIVAEESLTSWDFFGTGVEVSFDDAIAGAFAGIPGGPFAAAYGFTAGFMSQNKRQIAEGAAVWGDFILPNLGPVLSASLTPKEDEAGWTPTEAAIIDAYLGVISEHGLIGYEEAASLTVQQILDADTPDSMWFSTRSTFEAEEFVINAIRNGGDDALVAMVMAQQIRAGEWDDLLPQDGALLHHRREALISDTDPGDRLFEVNEYISGVVEDTLIQQGVLLPGVGSAVSEELGIGNDPESPIASAIEEAQGDIEFTTSDSIFEIQQERDTAVVKITDESRNAKNSIQSAARNAIASINAAARSVGVGIDTNPNINNEQHHAETIA